MRYWIILSILLVMAIAAVVGWQYKNHVDEVDAKKAELWRRLTDRESSTLAECLKHDFLIRKCMDIEAAVDKAIGR
jgi:hypothetical protein